MFGYITGIVTEICPDHAILETGGVGFKLTTSQFTNQALELGKPAKLFTKLNVREDDISLLGFSDRSELKMFELLTSVSKVGPKVALGILSSYDVANLEAIIAKADIAALAKASGVGKKTAERIIVELRDKVDKTASGHTAKGSALHSHADEALEVLLSLGFSKAEAVSALEAAGSANTKLQTNELVKLALAQLSRF